MVSRCFELRCEQADPSYAVMLRMSFTPLLTAGIGIVTIVAVTLARAQEAAEILSAPPASCSAARGTSLSDGSCASSSVPILKFARPCGTSSCEFQNQRDTGKHAILVRLLNPKFTTDPAAGLRELRVRGTGDIQVADDYCNARCERQFDYCRYRNEPIERCAYELAHCRARC